MKINKEVDQLKEEINRIREYVKAMNKTNTNWKKKSKKNKCLCKCINKEDIKKKANAELKRTKERGWRKAKKILKEHTW